MTDLSKIEALAKEAGKIMLEADNIEEQTHSKGSFKNLVTDFDTRVQTFIFSSLQKEFPNAAFLGEEEGADAFREEYRHGLLFVIDPIDGTSNFVKGLRRSVVSIGLFKDGKPYIGVIYNPYDDLMYSAKKGNGSYRNGKQIHTSENTLKESLFTMGTAPYYGPAFTKLAYDASYEYLGKTIDMRRSGSAAWDLCTVADGSIGLFVEPYLQIWDYAAGALIVLEAGGTVADFDGKPLVYEGPSPILAVSKGIRTENYLPSREIRDRLDVLLEKKRN